MGVCDGRVFIRVIIITVAQARAVGLRENFAGLTKLFCSTKEFTSCKAVSCKLFCL